MEFHIEMTEAAFDARPVEEALRAVDPSALADFDAAHGTLRISSWLEAAELVALLRAAGLPITATQVRQLPSICCGGCGG